MAIEQARHDLSYADYAAVDDGQRYELIEGELVPMGPAPFIRHQRVAFKIAKALDAHTGTTRQGETFIAPFDVVLANLLAPVIAELGAPLVRACGDRGTLVVSGLLADRWEVTMAHLAPLAVQSVADDDGWVAVVLGQR